ncbi:MAG: DUF4125 family protein [Dissulfuribacterales bacterium]
MEKEKLISQILEIELDMFVSVRSRYPVTCQEDPEGFRVMRSAQFVAWSEETLQSYLSDLKAAVNDGRNLMTLKYARMENLIPALHENSQIDNMLNEIVSVHMAWQKEMFAKYPALMSRGRPLTDTEKQAADTSFKTYLRCELETYSLMTLTHHFRDIMLKRSADENMTEAIYAHMVSGLGYSDLEEAEAAARKSRA